MGALCLVGRGLVVGVFALALLSPFSAWGDLTSLGTAYGLRGAELSLDEAETWLPLGSHSLPVMDGTRLRSRSGSVAIEFRDGSRVNLLPFSDATVREAGGTTEVTLLYGRLTFGLPPETRVVIDTARARLEPVRDADMVGEVFLGGEGTLGLQMTQGNLRIRQASGDKRVMVANLEPVFLPKRPETSEPLFTSEAPGEPPAGAKAVFGPTGESLGYLGPDAQLVVQPGYTNDLTRPFPPKLVRLAMARIPEAEQADAMPVFDVNGGYVGYLAGPTFHGATPTASVAPGGLHEKRGGKDQ